jgi:hypothetical protein
MKQAEDDILTVASCSNIGEDHRGRVVVAGSYGGYFNAYNASRFLVRGLVMSDAGVGKNDAGIRGLPYLDGIHLAAATADAATCHIGDGEHILEHGIVSHVNQTARRLGCAPGQTVRDCAALMRAAILPVGALENVEQAGRFVIKERNGGPGVICADSIVMLQPGDAGQIVITGSHAALFRGRPDNAVGPDVRAIFFSDAGIGLDDAGVSRLDHLDQRAIAAGAVSAMSAPIGDARAIYRDGVLSRVNATARSIGIAPGQKLRDAVHQLLSSI